ncbi:MAG: hypothetical protein AB1Z65_13360 [Candidatus Sulfomarinibacteraceae bacterium]
MSILRCALIGVCATVVFGCGAAEDVKELPAPERFDWGGGQPIRFSPAPADWRREKTTSGGLLGLRFVKSGSVGEGITMAEAFRFGEHDRCAEIDEMLAACDDLDWRELSDLVRKSRINVWNPVSDHEVYMGEQVNSAMDRAVNAAREGESRVVCRELETAREQAGRIVFSLDDLDEDELAVFRAGDRVSERALTLVGRSWTEVAGEPAYRRDYTFEHRGHLFIGRELFVMHNNRLFVAHFHGLEEHLPLFEGMIASIVFPAGECRH